MRSNALWIALACAACNAPDSAPPVAIPKRVAVAPEPPPIGVPHGGMISRVAITEQADAAVSLDANGGLRLWTTLDGTREPVAIAIPDGRSLAIGHVGAELLVAVVDGSGSARLLRFTRTGVLRASVQVPGDVAIERVVAIESGVLVARRDRSIERYDAAGVLQGRIGLDPGEELGAVAARHGGAAVLVGRATVVTREASLDLEFEDRVLPASTMLRTADALRWIDLSHGLQWAARVTMPPQPMDLDHLALSPNHLRFVVVAQGDASLHVLDGTTARSIEGKDATPAVKGASGTIGFLDDDHVVRVTTGTEWWVAASADPLTKDPWKAYVETKVIAVANASAAVGDGLVVSGFGPNLAMQSAQETRYLGWHDAALGELGNNGALSLDVGMHLFTLDRALRSTSELSLDERGYGTPTNVWWIDANHAVLQQHDAKHPADKDRVVLVDFREPALRVSLGTYAYVQRVEWSPELRAIAVLGEGVLQRFILDAETNALTQLAPIGTGAGIEAFSLLDPSRAHGANVVVIHDDDVTGTRRAFWIDDADHPDYKLPTKRGAAIDGYVIGISATGAIYTRGDAGLSVKLDAKTPTHALALQADTIAMNRTGDRIVGMHEGHVALIDQTGNSLWNQVVWDAGRAVFSPDGTQIVIQTRGGLIALDAVTGARTATACAFKFGIMAKPPDVRSLSVQPVCEDPGT